MTTTKTRAELKQYFVKNAIPTEGNFADLIDAPLNQADDGVFKRADEPFGIVAAAGEQKRALQLYSSSAATAPDWLISLNPKNPLEAGTTVAALGVADGAGNSRLTLDTSGNLVVTGKVAAGGYPLYWGNVNAFCLEVGGPNPTSNNQQATILLHHHGQVAHQLRYSMGSLYLEAAGNGYGTNPNPSLSIGGNLTLGMNLTVSGSATLGYETSSNDFNQPLTSGFYQTGTEGIPGDVPDSAHQWVHLIAARHSNATNHHQLQIASSYAENDRIFFRKIARGLSDTGRPGWTELATRGTNTFAGAIGAGGYAPRAGSVNGSSLEVGGPNPTAKSGEATIFFHHHNSVAHQLRYASGILYLEAAGNGYGTNNAPNLTVGGEVTGAAFRFGAGGRATSDQGGSLELGSSTSSGVVPYIDFHFGIGKAQDFNMRIINDADNRLWIGPGSLYVNAVQYTSDIREKKAISPLESCLDKLCRLRGISYLWNDDRNGGRRRLGLIAQEVEAVFPEAVETGPDGIKSVEYAALMAPLVEAIKSLEALVNSVTVSKQPQSDNA